MTNPVAGKHALTFIFMTVLIDTIGFGIVMPVMPRLIMELTGETSARPRSMAAGWRLPMPSSVHLRPESSATSATASAAGRC